jgi:hypothetical protein
MSKAKKADMAKNASQVGNVLFNKTLRSGHWSKVKFGKCRISTEGRIKL